MNVTFNDDVPEVARKKLAWVAERAPAVGIQLASLRTSKPDTNLHERTLDKANLVTYLFEYDDEGDCHVRVSKEH